MRELEGLGPGQGMFARDRAYQRSLQQAREGKPSPTKKEKRVPAPGDLSDTDSEADEEEDEEEKRLLESGGRDRCAYFFWQGWLFCHWKVNLWSFIFCSASVKV